MHFSILHLLIILKMSLDKIPRSDPSSPNDVELSEDFIPIPQRSVKRHKTSKPGKVKKRGGVVK